MDESGRPKSALPEDTGEMRLQQGRSGPAGQDGEHLVRLLYLWDPCIGYKRELAFMASDGRNDPILGLMKPFPPFERQICLNL